MIYDKFIRPFLFRMDPEQIHHYTISRLQQAGRNKAMVAAMRALYDVPELPALQVDLAGLKLKSPVGLAAGLDKDAQAVPAFAAMGFGFMEVGTVTPKPQPGNDKPRLFRLPDDAAIINRMGFNNHGAEAMASELDKIERSIPIAINIGKNKATPNERAVDDYLSCIRQLYSFGDFFVINISSPNTPDLRKLQHGEALKDLLKALVQEMNAQNMQHAKQKPLFVKLAPDFAEEDLEQTVDAILGAKVSGIVATNTTLSREGLRHANAKESGGLSGKPLTDAATRVIRRIYSQTQGKLPIIGVGGIFTAEDAYDKILAGANAIEIYTGFIYQGPAVVKQIHIGLNKLLQQDGFAHLSEAVGINGSVT